MTSSRTPRRSLTLKAGVLPFPVGRGGRRRGAGRKPKGEQAGVSHRQREALGHRFPVHVTVKLRRGLPRMRLAAAYAALRAAFAAGRTGGASRAAGVFRLCHYAVLNDHLHFILEAQDRTALARGAQGLLVRIARALNKLWRRSGAVFADRYHDRILRTPREVRNAIRYVLGNARKHAAQGGELAVPHAIDLFSSAPWFDGFRETIVVNGIEAEVRPVAAAETWLLKDGWRRHGLLSIHELPATG
jgi:hypothetical protein